MHNADQQLGTSQNALSLIKGQGPIYGLHEQAAAARCTCAAGRKPCCTLARHLAALQPKVLRSTLKLACTLQHALRLVWA